MDLISEEFLAARTGEPLEARLKNSDSFRQQMKSLHKASKAFTRDSVKSDECWKAFDRLEMNGANIISGMGKNPTV